MIPNEIVSVCEFSLRGLTSTPLATNFHSMLCLVAGVFIVADRVFWTSNRAGVARPGREARLPEMRAALGFYQSVYQEAVANAIRGFPTDSGETEAIGQQLAMLVQGYSARPKTI